MSKRSVRRRASQRVLAAANGGVETLEPRRLFTVTAGPTITQPAALSTAVKTISLANAFSTDMGTVVRFDMQDGDSGTHSNVDIELYDKAWGGHVAVNTTTSNFLSYVRSGAYNNTFIHRAQNFDGTNSGDQGSEPSLFLQGGGFGVNSAGNVTDVATGSPIPLQYNDANPNAAMTISMARTSATNSATSGFFLNAADNTSLFGSSNGGGYADFGTIVAGQSAITSYSELPRVNGSNSATFAGTDANGAVGTLPVAGDGTASKANLVYIRSATALQQLTYTAASSDESIVTPTLDGNGNLVLTYHGAGSATITLTATDYSGSVGTQTFTVQASAPTTVTLGGAVTTLNYTDSDGTAVTYTYAGPGTATFSFANATAAAPAGKSVAVSGVSGAAIALDSISIGGASSKSSLATKLVGGNVAGSSVASLTADTVGKLTLTGVTITDSANVTGAAGGLSVGGSSATGTVRLSSGAAVSLGTVTGGTLNLAAAGAGLKSLTIGSMGSATVALSGSTSAITAGTIGTGSDLSTTIGAKSVKVTGAVAGATLALGTAASLAAPSISNSTVGGAKIAKVSVPGAISGSSLSVGAATSVSAASIAGTSVTGTTLGSMSVGGAITGSTVTFSGAAGKVSFGSLSGAGVSLGSAQSVTVKGAMAASSEIFTSGTMKTFSAASVADSTLQGSAASSVAVKGAISGSLIYFPTGPLLTMKADSLTGSTLAVGVQTVPSSVSDFASGSVIKTLTLTNKTSSLSNSGIYVAEILKASVGTVQTSATAGEWKSSFIGSLSIASSNGKKVSLTSLNAAKQASVTAALTTAGLNTVIPITLL